MKVSYVILFLITLIVGCLAINLDRLEKKKSTKGKKVQVKAKTQKGIGDWSINDNNIYNAYIYVNDKEAYTECKFKGSYCYPSTKVEANKKKGWYFDECKGLANGLFSKNFVADGSSHFLDYRKCSAFTFNGDSSIWGLKGRTIMTTCKNNAGESNNITVMFQYGVFGDYITRADLQTFTEHVNKNRVDRTESLRKLRSECLLHGTNYDAALGVAKILSEPVTKYDAAIATANANVKAAKDDILAQDAIIRQADVQITLLKSKILKAQESLEAQSKIKADSNAAIDRLVEEIAQATNSLNTVNTNINTCKSEQENANKQASNAADTITNLTKLKTGQQNERDTLRKKLETYATNSMAEGLLAVENLKTSVPAHSNDISDASKHLSSTSFSLANFNAAISKVYAAGI